MKAIKKRKKNAESIFLKTNNDPMSIPFLIQDCCLSQLGHVDDLSKMAPRYQKFLPCPIDLAREGIRFCGISWMPDNKKSSQPLNLLNRHTLRQIPRLIHIRPLNNRHVITQQLQGQGVENRREPGMRVGDVDNTHGRI